MKSKKDLRVLFCYINIHMNLTNHLLVSLPTIESHLFEKSLIYIASHDVMTGTHGWILNKQVDDDTANHIGQSIGFTRDIPIFFGGPVNISNVSILHSPELRVEGTVELNSQLYFTRQRSIVKMFNRGIFPKYWKVLIGYSAWMPNQLENEFNRNNTSSWSYMSYDNDIVWNNEEDYQWNDALNATVREKTEALLAPIFSD